MKKIILLLCVLFVATGCSLKKEDTREVLYKFDTKSYDYRLSKSLMFKYTIDYDNEDGEKETDETMVEINENNKCLVTTKSSSDGQTYSSGSSSNCKWEETDDGINLEFTLKNIYKPCTSCDEQTTFTDYNLDGIYLEKGKYLALNKALYENVEYTMLKKQNKNIIYYDKNNKSVYTEVGYPAFNVDSEYRKTHQIKISDYRIVDKTENN